VDSVAHCVSADSSALMAVMPAAHQKHLSVPSRNKSLTFEGFSFFFFCFKRSLEV